MFSKRRSSLQSQKIMDAGDLGKGASLPFIGRGLEGALFVFIALVLLVVSAMNIEGLENLKMRITDAVSPALQVVSEPITQGAIALRDLTSFTDLQTENARLLAENEKLKEWYQTALLLEAENESLRELLNVKTESAYETITARVLADSGNAFVKSILVSAGRADGVEKNQAVLTGEGVVGRIIDAGEQTSRILLITDINSRVPVLVEDIRQHAILGGTNEGFLRLLHLPPDLEILSGARIVTSGHGGLFPPGLAVGRVEYNEDGARIVKPFVDFNRIVHVRIVDKSSVQGPVQGPPEMN